LPIGAGLAIYAPGIPGMRLTNESCIHNCGRNILSSVLDMGQLKNIKQVEEFCLKNVVKSKFNELVHFSSTVSEITNQNRAG
jgi:hypothetical protein